MGDMTTSGLGHCAVVAECFPCELCRPKGTVGNAICFESYVVNGTIRKNSLIHFVNDFTLYVLSDTTADRLYRPGKDLIYHEATRAQVVLRVT